MKEMWNSRYAANEYAFGIEPNDFFKETLLHKKLSGKILMPAEGEGRNAVFAAKNGLEVSAFDISVEGRNKALKLAADENVKIKYEVGDFAELKLATDKYDAAALIFAHFPPPILSEYHMKIGDLIKPGGFLILEGFSKNNLPLRQQNPKIGGPNNIEMLFSIEQIKSDFSKFEIIQLEEKMVTLDEGAFHQGEGMVIRFIGRKKKH